MVAAVLLSQNGASCFMSVPSLHVGALGLARGFQLHAARLPRRVIPLDLQCAAAADKTEDRHTRRSAVQSIAGISLVTMASTKTFAAPAVKGDVVLIVVCSCVHVLQSVLVFDGVLVVGVIVAGPRFPPNSL